MHYMFLVKIRGEHYLNLCPKLFFLPKIQEGEKIFEKSKEPPHPSLLPYCQQWGDFKGLRNELLFLKVGWEILIKKVAQAIATYIMSYFKLL